MVKESELFRQFTSRKWCDALDLHIANGSLFIYCICQTGAAKKNHPPRVISWSIQILYDPRKNSIVLQSSMTGPWLSVALFSYYIKWKKLHCTYYSKMNISERKRTDLLFPMYVRATIKVGNFYNISSSSSPSSFKSLSQDDKRKRERKDIQR